MSALRALVVLLGSLLVLTGCSLVDGAIDLVTPRPHATPGPETPPAGMEGTERFYAQDLEWTKCSGGFCTTLEVPVDYSDPSGTTVDIAVLKVPSSRRNPMGALVVNPGGPGGSGVDYARAVNYGSVVTPQVRRDYDVVGFDPRGVGRSAPVECLDDAQLDAWLAQDPTPDDPAEVQAAGEKAESFAAACRAKVATHPLIEHVSTIDAAKDMDILRSRLGESRLTYLGKSYGTYLGAVYAGLFPEKVGRMVLDGAIDPSLSSEQINLGQAVGFERATRAWAEHCATQPDCPFPGDAEAVVSGLGDFLREVDAAPIPTTGDPSVPAVTEGWASYGVVAAMYDQGMWDMLIDALVAAQGGDGSQLMGLANRYADRYPGGGYSTNLMQALFAVNCLDKPESADLAEREQAAQRMAAEAPLWGPFLAWGSLPCGDWPQPDGREPAAPAPITAAGSGPIVVVGTTRDPATPYEWAVGLADQLAEGTLVTFDGDGHTAYTRSNSCVNAAIDAWYLEGTVPAPDLRC